MFARADDKLERAPLAVSLSCKQSRKSSICRFPRIRCPQSPLQPVVFCLVPSHFLKDRGHFSSFDIFSNTSLNNRFSNTQYHPTAPVVYALYTCCLNDKTRDMRALSWSRVSIVYIWCTLYGLLVSVTYRKRRGRCVADLLFHEQYIRAFLFSSSSSLIACDYHSSQD